MPTSIERSQIKNSLDRKVIATSAFDVLAIQTAATTAFAEHGSSNYLTDAAFAPELQAMADRAGSEGLDAAEVQTVFQEVRRHVSIQSNFDASRQHEAKRTAAGRNIFEHIKLNWKDVKTTFGGGVGEDVRTKEKAAFANPAELKALMDSALELSVMRHRLKRYTELGKEPMQQALHAFKEGKALTNELLDKGTKHGKEYDAGVDNIITSLNLKVGEQFKLDGVGDIPIDNEETKAAIEHHLKFVLRTEVIKLAEAEELTVLSSDEYNVGKPTNAWQKAWQLGKGTVTSGTFWGISTRLGTRLAVGGMLGVSVAVGTPAIIGGVVVGVIGGVAGAYAREHFNAKERIKRRRLEAALGGIDDVVVKPASVINAELKQTVVALQAAAPDGKLEALKKAFTVAADAQARLRAARQPASEEHGAPQDYISFGVENRFKAQQQLLDNLEKCLAAIQQAMTELPHDQQHGLQKNLKEVNKHAKSNLHKSKERFKEIVSQDESRRRSRAMVIGGLAGGLGSLVSHYLLEKLGVHAALGAAVDSAKSAVPEVVKTAVQDVVTKVAGAEQLIAGKMHFFTDGVNRYILSLGSNHALSVSTLAYGGVDIESTTSMVLPDGVDDLQVVQTDQVTTVFDAQGKALAEIQLTAGHGDITEQLFADPEASKMLDAMGLQPGELQYDPVTKLFHIPDDALREAGGKAEYLGQTAGWRARRMEFILKALADGKTGESSEMIVARAERATANLLLKSASHGDPTAAYTEAFGKDAGFIQKNIMPWIDGTRSRVGSRWMQLVTELKQQPLTMNGSGEMVITATQPDAVAAATAGEQVAGEAAAQAGQHATHFKEAWNDLTPTGHIDDLMYSILGSAAAGGLAEAGMYAVRPKSDISKDSTNRQEYNSGDDYDVPDTKLISIQDSAAARVAAAAAEAARVAAAEATRLAGEKGPAVKAEIDAFIADTNTATKPTSDALLAVRTAMGTALDGAHIDQLIANAAGIDTLRTKLAEAETLLAKNDAGLQYQAIDAANGGRLAVWITSKKEALTTTDELQTKLNTIVAGTATHITATRKKTDADGMPAAKRRSELTIDLGKLTLPSRAGELVPGVIDDIAWKGTVEANIAHAKQEAELAIVVLDLNDLIGKNPAVRQAVTDHLTREGCFDPADPSLPIPAKAPLVARLFEQMKVKSNGKTGTAALRELKFLNSTMDPFDTDEEAELKRVLDRLFAGETDIFAK